MLFVVVLWGTPETVETTLLVNLVNALSQINIDITVGPQFPEGLLQTGLSGCVWGRPCHHRGQGPGFFLSSGISRQCQIWSNCRRRLNIRENGQRALPSPWIGPDDRQLNSRLRSSSSRLWWDPAKIGSLHSGFFPYRAWIFRVRMRLV